MVLEWGGEEGGDTEVKVPGEGDGLALALEDGIGLMAIKIIQVGLIRVGPEF